MILITAAALAMAGCGDDDEASSPEGAVQAYNEAVADGDGERACGYLDQAAQEELRQATQGDARGSCPQIIDLISAFYDDATKDRLRDTEVEADTEGDRAAARFTSPAGFGGPDREQTMELRRVGDEWKIVTLGLKIETPPEAP